MGSPFLLISSGQSLLSDDHQDASPRDFGTVPHTPHITGSKMTSDQSVPRTPDDVVIFTTRRHNNHGIMTGTLPATPRNTITTGAQNELMYGSLVPGTRQDSLITHPDQEVPATPQGGYIPPTSFQSPANLSQDSTRSSLAYIHTPSHTQSHVRGQTPGRTPSYTNYSHTPRQGIEEGSARNRYHHFETRSTQLARVRHTPTLSSRRRLSLDPMPPATSSHQQHLRLSDNFTTETIQFNTVPRPILTQEDTINDDGSSTQFQNHSGAGIMLPDMTNDRNLRYEENANYEIEALTTDTIEDRSKLQHANTVVRNLDSSTAVNSCFRTNADSQFCSSFNSFNFNTIVTPCEVGRSVCRQVSSLNEGNAGKRAEIERRVHRVLDSRTDGDKTRPGISSSTNSALDLFEDDEKIFV